MKNEFHIAFGVDTIYAPKMCVTIASILENNKNNNIIFHVIYNDLSDKVIDEIKKSMLTLQAEINFHFIDVDLSIFPKFSNFSHITSGAFLRFFIPELLQGLTDRALYLDADIICINNISDLFHLEMDENEILAVVEDIDSETYLNENASFQKRYFNSGVLMMDIEKWNKNNVYGQLLSVLNEKGSGFNLIDQDALNLVMIDKVHYLDNIWNYMINAEQLDKKKEKYSVPENAKFIHFVGPVKPWHCYNIFDDITGLYLNYQKKTVWDGLEMPKNYKEMRRYARYSFKKGNYLTGLNWGMRYIKTKFL